MLRLFLIGLFALMLSPLAAQAQGWDPRVEDKLAVKTDKRVLAANEAAAAFLSDDPSLQAFFDEAYGYAVFPKIRKGALALGGARGNGILFKRGEPAKRAYLTQYTLGLQFGGKSYSEIIFFRDRDAYDRFEYGEFAPSAQAQVIVANEGRGETAAYADDVAVFIKDKVGGMFEMSIGGQNFGTRDLK